MVLSYTIKREREPNTLKEFIEFAPTEFLKDEEKQAYKPEEEEKIMKRLRALRYIQ